MSPRISSINKTVRVDIVKKIKQEKKRQEKEEGATRKIKKIEAETGKMTSQRCRERPSLFG